MAHKKDTQEPLVIYIIADRRSGSTLLEFMLSVHPEAIALGELRMLHGHFFKKGAGARWDWNCTCGQPIKSCPFWTKVLNVFKDKEAPQTLIKQIPSKTLGLFSFKNSVEQIIKSASHDKKGEAIANHNWKIYNSVFEHTKKKIIIDSSKDATQAWYLWKYKKVSSILDFFKCF